MIIIIKNSIQRLQECKDKIDKKEQELKAFEAEMNDPNNHQEGMQARIHELLAESKEQTNLKKSLEDEFKQASAPCKQLQSQIQRLGKEVQNAKKETVAAQNRLKEYRDKMMAHEGSAESNRTRLADELRTLEEQREQCKDKVDPLRQATTEAYRAYEEVEPKVQEVQLMVKNVMGRLDRAKNVLRGLNENGNEFAVFGPKVKAVHDLVRLMS